MGILTSFIPLSLIYQVIFVTCVYWIAGLNSGAGQFFTFLLLYMICVFIMMHFCLALGYVVVVLSLSLSYHSYH